MQNKIRKRFVPLLSHELDERLRRQLFAELVRYEAVLGKRVVERVDGWTYAVDECGVGTMRRTLHTPLAPGTDSCSEILTKSEPPTTPMTAFLRSALKSASISWVTSYYRSEPDVLGRAMPGHT